MTGTVRTFSKRGFGFIEDDAKRQNIFFHISQCGGISLRSGDRVTYGIGDDPRNPHRKMALAVVLIDDDSSEEEKNDRPAIISTAA